MPSSLQTVSTSTSPRVAQARAAAPAPTARGRGRPTARAGRAASRPSRRACARARACGRRARRRGLPLVVRYASRLSAAPRVEVVLARQAARAASRGGAASSRVSRPSARPSSTGRAARSPCQNGILPGSPGAGVDQHAVARDLDDAPARGARARRCRPRGSRRPSPRRARRRAGPPRASRRTRVAAVGEEHAVEAAVGIVPAFATTSRCAPSRARTRAAQPVPGDARPQLGELVGGVAAGEHVEDALELRARQPANGAARRTSA